MFRTRTLVIFMDLLWPLYVFASNFFLFGIPSNKFLAPPLLRGSTRLPECPTPPRRTPCSSRIWQVSTSRRRRRRCSTPPLFDLAVWRRQAGGRRRSLLPVATSTTSSALPSTAPPLQARALHPGFQVRQRLGLGEQRPSLLSATSASSRYARLFSFLVLCETEYPKP